MHGCISGFALLVNAEVDSMGGVVDGGGGIGTKPSPQRAAIEKAQADLRQKYDVREERRRELEFLEKGGNPLDFKFGNAVSVSVQSTSLTDQPPEQEAKGSFALTASPHGDSVESSGRPGAPLVVVCECNSADNLMLFDGENEFLEGERNPVHPSRSNIAPSEQSSQFEGSQNAKESGDSAAFGLPKNAYRRRNRSRPNRDVARSSSTDVVPSRGGHASSLPSRQALRDGKGFVFDAGNQKDRNVSSNSNSKPTSPNGSMVLKTVAFDSRLDMELGGVRAVESPIGLTKGGLPDVVSDAKASKNLWDNKQNQLSQYDALETPIDMASGEPESVGGRKPVISAGFECPPCVATAKVENQAIAGQMNGFSSAKGDRKRIRNEGPNNSVVLSTKGLDSESSCTHTSLNLDGNNDGEICTNLRNIDYNGNCKEQTLASEAKPSMEGDELVEEKKETNANDSCAFTNDDHNSVNRSHQENGSNSIVKHEEELEGNGSGLQNEVKDPAADKGMEPDGLTALETEGKHGNLLRSNSTTQTENACTGRIQGSTDSCIPELLEITMSVKGSTGAPEQQACSGINKADEDSILEEARFIEAKRKRIAELSVGTLPMENRQKSHWDCVLDEMAWLANDFAQERLWKITAASQICRRVAFTSQLRFQEQNSRWKQKGVAHALAKAVMEFWHSVEETSKELELQCPGKHFALADGVQGYAVRFVKYNNSHVQHGQAEAPVTPDRTSDLGILDMSWEDHLNDENLFYTVPSGAMEAYRISIESHLLRRARTGSTLQEEVEISGYNALAENAFEEDEGETSRYYLPGAFEGSRSSKSAQKNRKNLIKAYAARSYEMAADFPFMQCMENQVGTQQSLLIGKRPANSLNAAIPTKRMRTASRQRVPSPFSAGTSGCIQAPNKTDASSGDTNSFQDDLSTLQGGSQFPNSLEVESVGDFEKQLPFDSAEVSNKPKKKKKAKRPGSTYEHRWQVDSHFQNEQRDPSKRRLESHQLESNGSSGLFGQHIMKKPKMIRQSQDNSFDNLTLMPGSIPSPVASQMSNMSNPNKFIKMLGGRDRGRKAKALKMPAGQPGSGSPWSLFEDQALVVLVHDMGPNWELVSDAINSTLQFKCIFRKSKECKERHNVLMDRTAGDGADSAEDSGSSQPYPSTLPGIPKGSARQLFQRLQGPMEEDTLKSHFEKVIMVGQKQRYRRTQNDNQDPKQTQQPHCSHTLALSQVCPNNLNGGPVLTPLDLCDASAPSPDVLSLGYQGPHSSGLQFLNQGTVAPMLPASGANSSVQGSSNVVLGSNLSSSTGPLNASVRDGRSGIPRASSLTIDEQQRMQQCNQMLSGRNIQQSSLPVPGALQGTDRGVRMLAGGNGMGIMCGLNRSMPIARPGFQGIASSPMPNSGSILASGMVAMPSPATMHSGAGPGQGSSMLRPRDALHVVRPSQNPEHQRQMMVPELQMQVPQGNSPGGSPFGGLSSFSNQIAPPLVQSYPLHHQQAHAMSPQPSHVLSNSHHPHLQGPNHTTNTQHQACAIRFAKERHPAQRLLQQQFAASNALMPHVQPQSQLALSSTPQNNPQIQSQSSSPPVSLSPLTASSSMTPMSQHPQKHHMLPHGLVRPQTGGNGLTNQMGKQRLRQPQQQQLYQQGSRHHPQQRQQSQSQQQAKLSKGVGRGNIMMHQNLPVDPSSLSGLPTTPGSQSLEKGEQVMHLMQGQGLYSGSGLNCVQPPKQLVPPHPSNQSHHQQKIYSGQTPPSSKQLQQMPSHCDGSNKNHVPPVASGPTSSSHQAVPPSVMASSNHQQPQPQPQPQPHLKLVNQIQPTVQRVIQQNRQASSDPPSKLHAREAQAERHPVNNSSHLGTTVAMPQACIDANNVISVDSSASSPQWRASEPFYDSGMPNHATKLGSIGTPSVINSAGSEPPPSVSQGLGQRQSSSSLHPISHDIGLQWQHQPSQLQPPAPPPPLQQQQQQSPQQQSQQQSQLLQAGNNSLYVRPTNSRLE